MPFLELEGRPDLEDNPRELIGEMLIGSGSQASWRIPGQDLAARHFKLKVNGGASAVVPASPQNVVVLNGVQVPTAGSDLNSGDVVAAGSARFIYLDSRDSKRPAPLTTQPDAHLVDPTAKKGYTLRRRVVQIGREIGCSIVLKDPTVSRFHADVRAEGGEFVLYSMGSAGTRVNGQPVSAPRMLIEGDSIGVGDTTFTFTRKSMPPGVRPVQFEDHDDDSFSKSRTQLAQKVVTMESGRFASRRRSSFPVVPMLVGSAVVVVGLVMYLVFR